MNFSVLLQLAITFATTAIVSVGGLASMFPEIHRQAVSVHGWMTDGEFAAAFALAQMAPGPNVLLMSLIGWRVAGGAGMLVATLATLATVLPTSIIALAAGRAEKVLSRAKWYEILRRSLPPLVVGLIMASAIVTGRAAIDDWLGVVLAAGVAVYILLMRSNPLVPLFIAMAIGVAVRRMGF